MKRCLACEAVFAAEGWTCPSCGRQPERRFGHIVFAPALLDGGGQDAEYTEDAILEAEARHFWFEARSRLIEWALDRHFRGASSLLEVGCGTGFVLGRLRAAFPSLRCAATDARIETLAHAAAHLPGVPLYQMDARRIPFREEFDAVTAFDVIEHIDEDAATLAEMHAALRPGGGVILTVPQHPWLWSTVDDWSHHRRRYTRKELVTKLQGAGLRLQYATSFTSLLLPLLALARLRRRPLADFDPLAELRIGSVPNAVLRMVSTVERACVRAGLRFPAGGSLLAVARRAA